MSKKNNKKKRPPPHMRAKENQRGGAAAPVITVEGIDVIIKRDLSKHKAMIVRTQNELHKYRLARSHEVQKKKHYRKLIGGGKYNDDALRRSMKDIAINIRHMSDRCDQAEAKLKHHELIVDTLTKNLENYEEQLKTAARSALQLVK